VLALAIFVLLGILIVFVGPIAARPFVQAKLRAMVKDQLNADLEIGPLAYHFPYGVSVDDARLTAAGPDGKRIDILSARHLSIALAKFPIGSGPLVIRSLVIDSPAVHLIKTHSGFVGQGLTVKPDQPTGTRKQKLSEMFELRNVKVTDGQLIFDDRTAAGAVPLSWRGLKLDLKTGAQSAAKYAFDLDVGDGAIASLLAAGWFNIDELFIHVERCALKVNVDPSAPDSPIPADLQLVLKKYEISGALALTLAGDVPLMDPARGKVTTTLELPRANGRLPDADAALDELAVKVTFTGDPAPAGQVPQNPALRSMPLVKLHLDRIAARSRDTFVRLESGNIVMNASSGAWGVSDLRLVLSPGADCSGLPRGIRELIDRLKVSGQLAITINGSGPIGIGASALDQADVQIIVSPQDLLLHPPELPLPLTDFGDFTLRLTDNVVTIETARCGYGQDVFYIERASVPLRELPKHVAVKDLAGCITFGSQPKKYPAPLAEYTALADPRGPFWFKGSVQLEPEAKEPVKDYRLRVTTDRGAVSTMERRLLVYNIDTDVTATPKAIEVNRFRADVLSGKVTSTGRVDLSGSEPAYVAQIRLRQIDLNSLAQMAVKPGEKPITVSGELAADVTASGRGFGTSALDAVQADGAVRVDRGELMRVPILDRIVGTVGIRNAGAVGEAAATFSLKERKIRLSEAAVNSPAVGVRGRGELTLDGALDMNVIARAFSDWEKQIRGDDSGAVANVVGAMAGSVQRGLDSAAENVLYHVHVGGTIDKPDVQVVTGFSGAK
jgi:hypothetical protein